MGCGASNAKDQPVEKNENTSRSCPVGEAGDVKCPIAAAHAEIYPPGVCPYSKFFGDGHKGAERIRMYSKQGMETYEEQWRKGGELTDVHLDDHLYTGLGKGGTAGVLAGSLQIGTSATDLDDDLLAALPQDARLGLFAEKATYPGIFRVSTFALREKELFYRFGLKIPFHDEEVNLTAVSDMDYFMSKDYDDLPYLVKHDDDQNLRERVAARVDFAKAVLGSAFNVLRGKNMFQKTYYGQLPYRLGDKKAFKYRFRCVTPAMGEVESGEGMTEEIRNHMKAVMEKMPVAFSFEIQIHNDVNADVVQNVGDAAWDLEWREVGVLTLPQQKTDEFGFSTPLHEALSEGLTEDAKKALGGTLLFHPAQMPEVHYPVGQIQHMRAAYYALHAKQRFDLHLKNGGGAYNVNYKKLAQHAGANALFTAEPIEYLNGDPEIMPKAYEELDRYTRILVKSSVPALTESLLNPIDDAELDSLKMLKMDERSSGKKDVIMVGDIRIELLEDDELFGELPLKSIILLKAVRSKCLGFAIDDSRLDVTDKEAADVQVGTGLKMITPNPHRIYEDPNSDDTLSKFVFHGYGLPLVELDEASDGYMLDFSHLKDIATRDGFVPYGVKAYFSADQKLTRIEKIGASMEEVSRDDAVAWEQAKFLVKSSLCMYVTGVMHLLGCHFLVVNNMCNARHTLPPAHPVYRLLSIPLFRSVTINNQAANSLLRERSSYHRASALEWSGLQTMLERGVGKCDLWKPMPQWIESHGAIQKLKAAGGGAEPGFTADALQLYTAHRNYVGSWLKAAYADENAVLEDKELAVFWKSLVDATAGLAYALPAEVSFETLADTLAQFMFTVTGYHELYGTIGEYLATPSTSAMRVAEGKKAADLQAFLITNVLLAATSVRTPMLLGAEWKDHFTDAERVHWDAYQKELEQGKQDVEARNAARDVRFPIFNPGILECAVSV
eukprot:TRINITY_DN17363_c0_g1_i1.p1 TRINITY_DN17363_c0_g1~~TRINITY_DN17363_c0_g1_i1.p1  ORF type:complete len:952 (+),score=372.37 TRINITY_DN17363_c0_g1_i1:49-2904(+)